MKKLRKTIVSIAFLATAVLSAQAMGGFGGMPMMGGFGGGAMPAGGMPMMGGFGGGAMPAGGMPMMGGFGGGAMPAGGMPDFGAMGGFGGMPMMGGFGGAMPGQTSAEAAKPDKGSQIPAGYNADGPTYVKVSMDSAEKDCAVCKLWDADKKAWKDIEPLKKQAGGMGMFGGMMGFGGGSLLKAGFKQIGDISYVKDGSKAQTMDVYLPEIKEGQKVPAIIYIHGGAWLGGDSKGCNAGFFDRLTKAGYAVFSINYRLSSEALFPRAMNDAKAAVRYVRAHAKEYGIDADHIGAIGDSAGGNMVGMLGTTSNIKGLMMGDIADYSEYSSAVQAVVDLFGPINLIDLDKQAKETGLNGMLQHDGDSSPEGMYIGKSVQTDKTQAALASPGTYAHLLDPKTAPAFLIQHGTQDTLVPIGSSKQFADDLIKVIGKEKVIMETLDGAAHEDGRFFDEKNSKRVIEFLDKYLKVK